MTAQVATVSQTLEQRIKERIREAKQEDIFGKAETIAKELGVLSSDNPPQRIFEDRTMKISLCSALTYSRSLDYHVFHSSVQITSGGVVFSGMRRTHGGGDVTQGLEITAYIPGAWTTVLDRLYDTAKAIQEARERAQTIKRYNERWSGKTDLSRAAEFGFFD